MDELRFAYRRYRLRFRQPLRTARALWTEREGLIVRLEGADGRVGWGEAAPVPAFGMESISMLEEGAKGWPAVDGRIVPTLACAVRSAQADLEGGGQFAGKGEGSALPVAALLPAGRAAIGVAKARAEVGFRTLKWKVGVADWKEEIGLLDDLCAALPAGSRLRLDANGAWDRRAAERWLERCADRPVEMVEQPVDWEGREAADLLLGLAADYPTPIGLDESLVGAKDVETWLGRGWPGIFVIKPSLYADVGEALRKLAAAQAKVVFSSAIETAVGARAALRAAFAWTGPKFALGFGVWPAFEDARFDGPSLAPFIRRSDVTAKVGENIWNALS